MSLSDPTATVRVTTGGAHDFDFILGRWRVHNRKLREVTDPDCAEWVEFDAISEAFAVLGGTIHLDRIHVADPPDGKPFEGLTLRMFDSADRSWSIWWASTRVPGRLDPPVAGRFADGVGVFGCTDVVAGWSVGVRFAWHADPVAPRWQQSLSYDDGLTWQVNWVMQLHRQDP